VAHTSAQNVQASRASQKLSFPVLESIHAGIIATSLGKGKKLDSKTIIKNISVYPICHMNSLIISIIWCI